MGLSMHITLCCLGVLITNYFLGVPPIHLAKAQSCPRGWLKKQRTCYGYFENKLDWHAAETECQNYKSDCHLASLLTRQESLLVAQYIKSKQNSPSKVWIGLHDNNEKRWRWTDESAVSYSMWRAGEPNNVYEKEHCVELTYDTSFRKWNDLFCDRLNAYICKYQL